VTDVSAKQLGVFFFIAVIGSVASVRSHEAAIQPVTKAERNTPKQADQTSTQVADQDDAAPVCPTSGPKGDWGEYREKDLPRGSCSGPVACVLWTKDTCPGTDSPGPAVKWKCVCASGVWRCDELERTKTACINPKNAPDKTR
jgi:hypothetical protein